MSISGMHTSIQLIHKNLRALLIVSGNSSGSHCCVIRCISSCTSRSLETQTLHNLVPQPAGNRQRFLLLLLPVCFPQGIKEGCLFSSPGAELYLGFTFLHLGIPSPFQSDQQCHFSSLVAFYIFFYYTLSLCFVLQKHTNRKIKKKQKLR